jgi:hypothetical protein
MTLMAVDVVSKIGIPWHAGVVDRIDETALRGMTHWRLPKAELLQRTKEWNEAWKNTATTQV